MASEHPNYEQQKLYYDSKWLRRMHKRLWEEEMSLLGFIMRSVRQVAFKPRPKILDLGCGRGWITHALSQYGEVIGVDLSTEVAMKLYPGLVFKQANIVTDELEGKYDIVVSSEVIEHLSTEDQRVYVKKAYALLDESGYLIMTTPNRPKNEELFEALPRIRKYLQPIENWLDRETLSSLLAPYFEITYIGSAVFRPLWIRKIWLLNAMYVFAYSYLNLNELLDRLVHTGQDGLYLTVVARRRALQRSSE